LDVELKKTKERKNTKQKKKKKTPKQTHTTHTHLILQFPILPNQDNEDNHYDNNNGHGAQDNARQVAAVQPQEGHFALLRVCGGGREGERKKNDKKKWSK
jgi:hypothetical protein